jgi:hypothetical protein
MQALARLERIQTGNRRAAPRRQLSLYSILSATGDEAVIHDISETGMLVETDAELATFEQLHLDLPEAGRVVATVMWNSGKYFGCEFDKPILQRALSAALLKSSHHRAWSSTVDAEEPDEDAAKDPDDRLPPRVRVGLIFSASLALWAIILWGIGVL